jgi:hypothetical protein
MRVRGKGAIVLLALAAMLPTVAGGRSAELPTMKTKRPEAVKTCEIGGMAGVLVPGSGMCVKIGGYISAEAAAAAGRH